MCAALTRFQSRKPHAYTMGRAGMFSSGPSSHVAPPSVIVLQEWPKPPWMTCASSWAKVSAAAYGFGLRSRSSLHM